MPVGEGHAQERKGRAGKATVLAQAKYKRQEAAANVQFKRSVGSMRSALNAYVADDDDELDVDVVCPKEDRIYEGMLLKRTGIGGVAEATSWKPRLAVLTKERWVCVCIIVSR